MFWVDAETAATTEQSIRASLESAALHTAAGGDVPGPASRLAALWRAMLAMYPLCLVVFDNVEAADDIAAYFPSEVRAYVGMF